MMNNKDCMKKHTCGGHLSVKENCVLFVFSSISSSYCDATLKTRCPAAAIRQSHQNPDPNMLCTEFYLNKAENPA